MLVEHAKKELARAGNDKDFDNSIIAAAEAFATYGHSGGSAGVGIWILGELLQFKNITPLTEDPAEWMSLGDGTWQSNRCSEAFSHDGGFTYYLLSEGGNDSYPYPAHKTNRVEEVEEGAEAQDREGVHGD